MDGPHRYQSHVHFLHLTVALLLATFGPLLVAHQTHSAPVCSPQADQLVDDRSGATTDWLMADASQVPQRGVFRLKTAPSKPWIDASISLPAPADGVVSAAIPLEQAKPWQFTFRSALHPRAPTLS